MYVKLCYPDTKVKWDQINGKNATGPVAGDHE